MHMSAPCIPVSCQSRSFSLMPVSCLSYPRQSLSLMPASWQLSHVSLMSVSCQSHASLMAVSCMRLTPHETHLSCRINATNPANRKQSGSEIFSKSSFVVEIAYFVSELIAYWIDCVHSQFACLPEVPESVVGAERVSPALKQTLLLWEFTPGRFQKL